MQNDTTAERCTHIKQQQEMEGKQQEDTEHTDKNRRKGKKSSRKSKLDTELSRAASAASAESADSTDVEDKDRYLIYDDDMGEVRVMVADDEEDEAEIADHLDKRPHVAPNSSSDDVLPPPCLSIPHYLLHKQCFSISDCC